MINHRLCIVRQSIRSTLSQPHPTHSILSIPTLNCSSRLPNLYNFARPLLITSQHGPTSPVGLYQCHLQLCAHDLERRSFGINCAKEWNYSFVAFGNCVCSGEIEGEFMGSGEGNDCFILVDFLQEEGCNYRSRSLVEIVSISSRLVLISKYSVHMPNNSPNRLQNFLTTLPGLALPSTPNKQMCLLSFAPLNLHKLIELQHSPLTACIPLAPLVKNRHTGMKDTLLPPSPLPLILLPTSLPSTSLTDRNLERRIVILGFWRGRRRSSCGLGSRSNWRAGRLWRRRGS